jgi:DegV family protein with EDD domain
MSRVAIVTDTTQYLPDEVVARHGLSLVSLYVNWAGRTDRESDLADYDAFYDHLRSGEGEMPSTSQPSVGDFLAVFEPLLESGADVLAIHLSGAISGTVRAAEQAREALIEHGTEPERIAVMDSRTGCAGHGLMAVAAANAVAGGAGIEEAAAAAQRVRETITIIFAVDTLEFLRRGGRIGAAQAWIGSALKIKPILAFDNEIAPVERVRTSARAIDRLVQELRTQHDAGADVFFVQHVQAPEVAERVAGLGAEVFGRGPEFISEIGPVIGTHTGPGLIGVTGTRSDLLGSV